MKRLAIIYVGVLLIVGALGASCRPSPPTPTPTPSLPVHCFQDPVMAKADTILGVLLGMKNLSPSSWPDPWREALERPTLVVGLRMDHELKEGELESIKKTTGVELGKTYHWLDSTVSYGAIVTWEQICPLLRLPGVIRMSTGGSQFNVLPSGQQEGGRK